MYNPHAYHLYPQDAYVVRPYDPHHIHRPLILITNQDLTFAVQKYRFDDNYIPLFRREICLNFHIDTCERPEFPQGLLYTHLTGRLRPPLSTEHTIDARLDRFIRELTESTTLTIHYNDKFHHGCIIHSRFDPNLIHADQLQQIFQSTSKRIFTKPSLPQLTSSPNDSNTSST